MPLQPQDTDLCTLADVKAWLGIPAAEKAVDDIIQRLVSNASVATLQWLSRSLFVGTFDERRNGTGTPTLVLKEAPIKEIKSLVIAGVTIQPQTSPTGAGYVFDADTVYLIGGGLGSVTGPGNYNWAGAAVFPRMPPLAVQIKYRAGYDDIPGEITEATIHWVALRFRERDRIGQSSKGLAGETTAYVLRDMPEHVRRMLLPYKRVAIL